MKICKNCQNKKEESAFYKDPNAKDGLQSTCRSCRSEQRRLRGRRRADEVPLHKRRTSRRQRSEKPCNVCGVVKLLEDFHRNAYAGDGTTNTCKTCGITRSLAYNKKHKTRIRRYQSEDIRQRANRLLRAAADRARREGVAFELCRDWLVPKLGAGQCEVTGIPLVLDYCGGRGKRIPWSPSIDRIIPGGDYTVDNCRVVCTAYNLGRSNFTDEDMLILARALVATSKSKR